MENLFRGYGWTPYFVEGSDPESMHQAMAATVEQCISEIRKAQQEARSSGVASAPALADDCAAHAKGLGRAGGGRRPQAGGLLAGAPGSAGGREEEPGTACKVLENWMRAQKPEELFDANGKLIPELKELAPTGTAA